MKVLILCFPFISCFICHAQPYDSIHKTFIANDHLQKNVFQQLRNKWKDGIVGSEINVHDSDYKRNLQSIAGSCEKAWAGLSISDTAVYLWKDLQDTTKSGELTNAYNRIKSMAIAYCTNGTGTTYYKNAQLKKAVLHGLNWMYRYRYHIRKPYENWFAWEIGVPMALNDIMVLMYEDLTPAQIQKWTAVIDHFCPNQAGADSDYKYWGANRVWRAYVHAVRGIVGENEAKMILARDGLSDVSDGHTGKRSVFKYVTEGDGFYRDGSFIQHFGVAYNGGYGKSLLSSVADVLYILHDTPWEVTDSEKNNVYGWVYNAFIPFIYKHGQMMDMVRGREISRHASTDTKVGILTIGSILRLSQLAPESHRTALQRAVKYWIQHIPDYYASVSINQLSLSKRLMRNAAVLPMDEPVINKIFSGMDRVVHLRKGWGFGLSMNSTRQSYYEAHTYNYENGSAWYTAEGMTYLYLSDPYEYGNNYWPTVNMHRLPGTTEDAGLIRADQSGYSWNPLTYSSKAWVGGASNGVYGVAGMEQDAWGATLTSKKSWFLFDDEIVALGAGITSTDNRPINTIIENRKLNEQGSNSLIVDGIGQVAKSDSATVSFNKATWMHLQGNVANADVGYYFPDGVAIKALREKRSGKWSDINRFSFPSGDPVVANHFQQIWFDHGANPANAAYAYVLLPNKAAGEVALYARKPHITILENSPAAQAVQENNLNITAINFWNDSLKIIRGTNNKTLVTCNKKAAVLLQQTPNKTTVSVSDPTQLNNGSIELVINKAAKGLISSDDQITISQLAPQIKMTINVAGTYGQTLTAKFKLSKYTNKTR